MGLFSKKDPCAICGGKVKGLFPWKIDGQLICGECHGVTDLPAGAEGRMTLPEFMAYREFREENAKLKDQFEVTQKIDFGLMDTKILFDVPKRLMCLDKNLGTTIFEGAQILSFSIREDETSLFEGSAQGLERFESTVRQRAMDMTTEIAHFRNRRQMREAMNRANPNKDNNPPLPTFDFPEPFRSFNLEIRFQHPYWQVFNADMKGPTFSTTDPRVEDYLRDYGNSVQIMEQLAKALMAIAFPGAGERTTAPSFGASAFGTPAFGAAPAAAQPVDAVTELQRFKALLDQGVITQADFDAKKRQLLGL